ncbi:MAG: hypothetical protein OXH11_16685 [Candidatus Aminicenantes bacterium]|nr:hypothetical protein [Candidatus Aminicenantes bacterium]
MKEENVTVSGLVRILQTYPRNMRVVVNGYETGFDDLDSDIVSVREICLNAGEEWRDKQHLRAQDTKTKGRAAIKALVLPLPVNV